jgi:transposase-like protein
MTDKPQLSPKQQLALQSLLAGRTKSQTAAAVGVTPRTLSRWLADPAFHAALTNTADEAIANAADRLADALDSAVAVLAEVMANQDARDPDRLRAADLVIHRGLDLIQQKQLIERIAALEAKTNVPQEP